MATPVTTEAIDVCFENYTTEPTFCDPQIFELAQLLIPDHEIATNTEEALLLFSRFVEELKNYTEEDTSMQ